MNLKQMVHMLTLAETGSYRRAAEQLFLTQSALSRSIQALESELGGLLFDRMGRKVEPTPLGQAVLVSAGKIVHEAVELRRSADLLRQRGGATLRLGLGPSPSALLMVPLLQHMARHYPRIRLAVSRGPAEAQLAMLRARELDALVVSIRGLPPGSDLVIEVAAELPIGFVCRADHPLASQAEVAFTDLQGFPVASTGLPDEMALVVVEHYGPEAAPSQLITLTSEDVTSLIEAISNTDAVFLGILEAASQGIANGTLVTLPMNPPLRCTGRYAVVTLAGRTPSPFMASLREFVFQHMGRGRRPAPD